MADMATETVKYGGRYYAPGELIEGLKAGERKELLAAGAIEVVGGQKGAGKAGGQKADGKDAGGHGGTDGANGGAGEGGEE